MILYNNTLINYLYFYYIKLNKVNQLIKQFLSSKDLIIIFQYNKSFSSSKGGFNKRSIRSLLLSSFVSVFSIMY